ncbi:hypothetical protein J11TS1_07640 [Oceanobacillus sp. J11TS1]|nr:hypothetical protein J11TS1_07640 [Oceanobacillus sp. J11TS1]
MEPELKRFKTEISLARKQAHLSLYDSDKKTLNGIVDKKSPEGHIPWTDK